MKNLLIFLCLIFFYTNLSGQTNLFESISNSETIMTEESQQKIDKLSKSDFNKKIQIIKINNLKKLQKDGEISFRVPGYKQKLTAKALRVLSSDNGDFTWQGNLVNKNKRIEGSMTLISEDGAIYGSIITSTNEFSIEDLGESKNKMGRVSLIIEKNINVLQKYSCHDETVDAQDKGSIVKSQMPTCASATVDVLVLYTQNAENTSLNISNTANLGISKLNLSTGNSGLSTSEVSFTLAGVVKLNGFTEGGSISSDLDDLKNDASAQSHRDQYNADLVILYTDGNYSNYSGWAYINTNANSSLAYGIVEIQSSINNTFVHEVGHLFGCRHQSDPNSYSERGHSWNEGAPSYTARKTIMHQTSSNTIDHFSNPNINYNGYQTGTTGTNNTRDNTSMILSNACDISEFESPPTTPFTVHASGPTNISSSSNYYTWCSYTVGCTGSNNVSNYYWSYSSDGFNYYTFATGSSCGSKQGNTFPVGVSTLFIKVTAVCSNGQTDTDIMTVTNWSYNYLREEDSLLKSKSNEESNDQISRQIQYEVFPNPVSSTIKLQTTLDKPKIVNLILVDQVGKVAFIKENIPLNRGKQILNLSVADVRNGLYFLHIDSQTEVKTISLLIQK